MRSLVRVVPGQYPSFAAFYTAHLPIVVRYLGKLGVHKADIPDIAQQVFLKIHKYWDKPPVDGVGMSLETICKQQAAEHYRLLRNQLELPEPNVGVDMPAEDDDAQQQLERHEYDVIIQRVLASMDPMLRDLLVRSEFKDESLESIAKSHGIARNTAYARLAEAKKVFRLRIERMLGEKPTRMLLLPFGAETRLTEADLTREFLEEMNKRIWPGLARELGFDELDVPKLVFPESDPEPPQSGLRPVRQEMATPAPQSASEPLPLQSTAKNWIKKLLNLFLTMGTGILIGVTGSSLWSNNAPLTARHIPFRFGPVLVLGHSNTNDAPATSATTASSAVTRSVTKSAPSTASRAPGIDRETSTLHRARTLITRGQYSEALAMLEQHEQQFPRSEHAETRKYYIGLAQKGRQQAAAAEPRSD